MLPRLSEKTQVFSALRYPNYRLYWIGMLLSVGGFQVMQVAEGWLMYDLTGQAKYLGFLGLALAVPTISLSLFGGAMADRLNQRWLIMGTQGASAALVAALATLVLLGMVQVWHILVIAFLGGAVQTFDHPARMSLYPHLIDRKVLMNAVVLNNSVWQGTRLVGPVMAGFLIAFGGMALPFYLTAACFLGMVLAIKLVQAPAIQRARRGSVLTNIVEGLSFVRSNSTFAFLIGMSYLNGFFGLSYIMLLPIFSRDILSVGPMGLGVMNAASAVGSLLVIGHMATRRDTRHKGVLLLGGATLFGVALILFAYSRSFPLSLLLLAVAGGSTSLYMMMIQTIIQARVPDQLRGRVMGIYGLTWSMMPLGALQAGFIADLVDAPFAVALGGFVLAAFAVAVAVLGPGIRNLGPEPVPEAG